MTCHGPSFHLRRSARPGKNVVVACYISDEPEWHLADIRENGYRTIPRESQDKEWKEKAKRLWLG